jgi:hypothetical protein
MKKRQAPSKPLSVATETVRELTTRDDLVLVNGARPQSTRPDRSC